MAVSRYKYVKSFELPDPLLPGTFVIFRLDGHSFHRFSDEHGFTKPNDENALRLMDHAARDLMEEYGDIALAFGESDEFSFLLRKSTTLYNRRHSKILTTLTSLFTSSYVLHWPEYFPDKKLRYPPSFDGRIVLYPSLREVRDYFSWRQADTHINNLYNTVFWALILRGGQSAMQAHEALRGTVSSQKHEILFTQFKINYNSLPARYRKGSILVRERVSDESSLTGNALVAEGDVMLPVDAADLRAGALTLSRTDRATSPYRQGDGAEIDGNATDNQTPASAMTQAAQFDQRRDVLIKTNTEVSGKKSTKQQMRVTLLHCDIIGEDFWNERPYLLEC